MPYVERDGSDNVVAAYEQKQVDGQEFLEEDDATVVAFIALTKSNSRRTLSVRPLFISTKTVTIRNTSDETSLIGEGFGSVLLEPDFFQTGRAIRVTVGGQYSAGVGAPGITLRVKLGSTVIFDSKKMTGIALASDLQFKLQGEITCRDEGEAGEVSGQGNVFMGQSIASVLIYPLLNITPIKVDITKEQLFDVTFQWDSASDSNTVSCTQCLVEVLG